MRAKKAITGMMPVKKFLSKAEAMAYMDMSINIFEKLALDQRLTTAIIGGKKYYKVAELDKAIEESILINQ